ncbi:kinetochore scaffold 1 isoform X2 [Erinaceus europaeus]|uniref:Kinetochore scaffold 1 isoform X2 n=1 Tax=Erinaceus europaeus TaxID=9365 RepID=A0ABM3W3G2_ERIEU|nr:kinetochore scaffold 1 isoform X2 [Erinaceus europaeus]
MNGISSAANEENDSTERPARRRRSSILKPPRSPLQDLGDGNEITQGPNAFRSRKSSRRVSFADTIKVFETELHMKTEKKSENSETEGRENVIFIQNKSPEDNNCEITGMNTLLCAPIQTQVQRRKISSTEHNYERTHPSDQTAIFPDENKMDFTASHTVMITNGLLACTKSEKSSKIDTTSFLANLKLHTEDSRMKKEPMFSLGQNSTSERKINFNDFKKRLEAGKFNACSSTGPDKENLEIPVYYKDSNRGSAIHQKHVAFNADENNSNMTKILREQDDVMNFTQCHTVNIQTLVPTPSKAHLREFKGDDTTICGNDCMDLTTNHTVQILPSADNLSELENQTHVLMDIATDYGTNTQGIKIIFKDKLNTSFQDPSLNPKGTSETALYACGQEDMEVTRSHTTAIDCKTVTTNEIFRPMDKTVMFVDDRDELEMTKSHTIFIDYQALEKTELPGTLNSELSEKKSLKKSKVVSIPAEESVFFPENGEGGDHSTAKVSQLTLPGVGSDNDPGKKVAALVGDGNMEVSQSAVGKSSRHVQNPEFLSELSQSQRRKSLRLKNDKTIVFSKDDDDMDITRSCTVEINHRPLLGEHNSHFVPLAGTLETALYACGQEDMEVTRSHTTAIDCKTVTTNEIVRPMDKTVMFVDDRDELEMTKSHTIFIDYQALEKTELPGTLNSELSEKKSLKKSKVVSIPAEESVFFPEDGEGGDHSTAKVSQLTLPGVGSDNDPGKKVAALVGDGNMEVSQSAVEKSSRHVQNPEFLSELSQSQRRKSLRLKNDKTIVFSKDDDDMDITRSCTVEVNHRPLLGEHNSHFVPLAGTLETALYACGQEDMEVTRSHTTAIDYKTVTTNEIVRPMDKTVMFVDDCDELEMTKSHTIFIDYQALEKTELPGTLNSELSEKKSLKKSKVVSIPAEESVFFPEDGEGGDHSTAKVSQLTLPGVGSDNDPGKKVAALVGDGNMEVSQSAVEKSSRHVQNPEFLSELSQSQRRKSLRLKNDKTIVFSNDDMDITRSCTVEINHRPLLGEHNSHFVPLAGTLETALYACGQEDMEVTRSHTTAIDCKTVTTNEIVRPMDKTVMFVDDRDELEMTKSHTIFIDYQALEKTELPGTLNSELSEKSLKKSKVVSIPAEESVFFPEDGEGGDYPTAKVSQLTLPGVGSDNDPGKKVAALVGDGNMEVSQSAVGKSSRDVQNPVFLSELSQSQRRKSLGLKNDKTVVFSKDDDDMDITRSCTVEVNHRPLLSEHNSHFVPLAGTLETALYACGQEDMEVTRSHTTAIDCKTVTTNEIFRPMDKTVMFVDDCDELEMTKSHTIFINYQALEKTELPGTLNSELSEKKSLKKSKVVSIPAEESVFFPENGEGGDHSTAKVSQLTLPGVGSDNDPGKKVAALVGDGNIEVFQSAVGKSSRDVQNPEFLSELSQSQRRKSLRFKNDKTIGSLKSDENDMDITKSCAVEINSSSDLEDKQDSHLLPLSVTSKTLLYTCGQDMELTRSHTAALQCETASIDKITIRPLDKTVMFVDNHNELQVTKSNTVFIDCQETEKLLYESTKLGITKSNTLSISFPTNSCSFKEMTNKQALDVEDKIIIHNKKNHRVLPFIPTNTLSKSQSEIEIKSHSNSVDKEVMGKVADQACTLEKAQLENYQLNRDNLLDISNLNSKQVSYNLEDPIIASNSGNISNIKPDLNNMDGKAKEFLDSQTVHVPPSSVLELISKANDTNIVQAAKVDTFNTESSKIKDDRAEENTTSCNEDANPIPLTAVVKDKMRRCSLGIFLPRLPNKKNVSVTGIDDLEQFPLDTTDLYHLETQPVSSKNTGTGFVVTKLDFSPSQYINEENLPIYPGEINSSDSISLELEEKALTETCQKEILPLENKMEETCNSQKRSWVPEEDDVQNEKKIRKSNTRVSDTAPDQISDHHTEGDTDKITNSALIKSLSRTPSSCSSSLDSLKADGTSLDCSTQHSSHMESQYLRDTICEDNLKEKLKDGKITLKEFLILLQVHILIQKPRQSSLPAKLTVNTPPTPEDMMLSQYVYRPKIQIYREDRDALHRKIEELNISALSQDKLLTDVNRDLWEKMRLYSDEELKAFGFYLNKIKSRFTKMTKVFTHQGKVTLYSKLVQSAQKEKEKLQMRINEMDNILQKIDKCLNDVEIELEQLKTEEKELQRNLLELEVHKKQTLDQINLVRKQTNETEELLDQLSLSEWDIIEWNDDQAVFTFLYDTVELTMTFGEQVVGVPFLDKTFYRKIDNLNFQSLLDEDKAPLSTLLVHKLVFQYIMEQGSWKKKYTTQHQVPKMLQEISLVTSRCRLLGEEIEFLKRWGPNYNLMNIDVNNTELKLLFSSSAAFTKFEITLSLTANYPSVQLPLSIHIHLGDIGKDEITAVLSKVPQKDNYLKNVVKHIYQDLLQDCHFSP